MPIDSFQISHVTWVMSSESCHMNYVTLRLALPFGDRSLAHRTAYVISRESCQMRHIKWVMSHESCHTSHVTRVMSHESCHTSHVTRVMSHESCHIMSHVKLRLALPFGDRSLAHRTAYVCPDPESFCIYIRIYIYMYVYIHIHIWMNIYIYEACHVSHVTWVMSNEACHVSHVTWVMSNSDSPFFFATGIRLTEPRLQALSARCSSLSCMYVCMCECM